MAETTDWNKRFDNIRLADLDYVEKDINDILEDLDFDNLDDTLITKDIITHLENTAAEEIQNDKCVQLPFIGSIRKNPLRKVLDENRTAFKLVAKNLSKEDAKAHYASVFQEKKNELRREDYRKAKIREVRNKNKTKYEQYFTHLGPAYANMYLHAILMMRMVEYNQDFEDRLKELNNE